MFFELIKMALESLRSSKTRTFLSMLGIIIGVSTVIAVFAVGKGAQNAVDEQFEGLSAKSIIIMSMRGRGTTGSSKLKTSDAKVILDNTEHIAQATSVIRGSATISFEGETENFNISGVDEDYFKVSKLELENGRLLTKNDLERQEKVAILGSGVVDALFSDTEKIIGQIIKIGGRQFEVIGKLKETGRNFGPTSLDESIVVPQTTAEKSILGNRAMIMITLEADSVDTIEQATEEVTAVLRDEHRLKSSQQDDFRVMDAGSMIATAQDAARLMTALLTAIAAITLLVSGIGIMNVMFVTVAERTKEIGIAKAIGGKQADILGQFLLESVMLSMIGGIIGIILGQGAIYLISQVDFIIKLSPSIEGVLIGFSFSVLVGVFFGFYPALKASRLDPVDALRSE